MWRDNRRICEHTNSEDRDWFPEMAGSDWRETFEFAMQNFKDENFIAHYLSPQLMREFRFNSVLDDETKDRLQIKAIHNESSYRDLRTQLAKQYNLGSCEPNRQVWNMDLRESNQAVLDHVAYLWGFTVRIEA